MFVLSVFDVNSYQSVLDKNNSALMPLGGCLTQNSIYDLL